nr:MAG TPA: hypothetical protein [Caudoviricetes sp.]
MKLQIEEAELRNIVYKAARYDIIMNALIREKFDKVDIYTDWEMIESYMQDILNQQPSNIRPVDEDRVKEDRDWMDKNPDFGQYN